jgi:hypothetical protein
MVERLFAELAGRHLRHGTFRSDVDLQAAINCFLEERNRASKPFIWTAGAETIVWKSQCVKDKHAVMGRKLKSSR